MFQTEYELLIVLNTYVFLLFTIFFYILSQ